MKKLGKKPYDIDSADTSESERINPRKTKVAQPKKKVAPKMTDNDAVKEYMAKLKHPLKAEMEMIRNIIKKSNSEIRERIKWKAPSYYYRDQDMVTFNGWAEKQVHLVFHHPAIVTIKSAILEGDYDTRRMVYFNNIKEVRDKKGELEKVMQELIKKLHIAAK